MPTVVAGDNLNMPILGSFLQHAGKLITIRISHDIECTNPF